MVVVKIKDPKRDVWGWLKKKDQTGSKKDLKEEKCECDCDCDCEGEHGCDCVC